MIPMSVGGSRQFSHVKGVQASGNGINGINGNKQKKKQQLGSCHSDK